MMPSDMSYTPIYSSVIHRVVTRLNQESAPQRRKVISSKQDSYGIPPLHSKQRKQLHNLVRRATPVKQTELLEP